MGTSPLVSDRMPGIEDPGVVHDACLANARIVLEDKVITGRVTIANGLITAIDEGGAVPSGACDAGGDFLMPGLVELHTDNLERHIEPRPGVAVPHNSAILAHDGELSSCGITTVFDALRIGSILSDGRRRYGKYARQLATELLALKAADALRISHFIHLRAEICSETLLEELAEFGADDRIGIVSLMDHAPGQRQFRDLGKLKQYLVGKHGMSDVEFAEHVAFRQGLSAGNGARHETAAVAAARVFGAVLASHDDTTADQVAHSAAQGICLAEFPTSVEAAQACRESGIAIMMGAPNVIRGGSHSGNISALELAERGLLDILSSDYVPSALLLSVFRLAELWSDLPRAVRLVTAAPAAASGLSDRGRIAVELRADLLRVRMFGETPVLRGCWSHGRQVG